jgi:hypothetical protein
LRGRRQKGHFDPAGIGKLSEKIFSKGYFKIVFVSELEGDYVILTEDSKLTPITEVAFPSVTICPRITDTNFSSIYDENGLFDIILGQIPLLCCNDQVCTKGMATLIVSP